MIEIENISKSFGNIVALDSVSLKFRTSQITVVTGPDGAGKSTLFKIIVGLVKRDKGEIFLKGRNIGRSFEKITSISGYMPERFSLYSDLSVAENLDFFAQIHGVRKKMQEERKKKLLEKTGMGKFVNRRARDLSGGMKQKLALSCILLAAPELIILDEPTTGVDPLSRVEFFNIINDLKKEGKTIILSTPYLAEAERGDYIVFLKNGKIIKEGDIDMLKTEFRPRLFSILPQGNIFEIYEQVLNNSDLKKNFYIKGKYLKYLQTGNENHLNLIPHLSAVEEDPKLEDIYIYYERGQKQNSFE